MSPAPTQIRICKARQERRRPADHDDCPLIEAASALQLLTTGEARLCPDQSTPPLALAERLRHRSINATDFGRTFPEGFMPDEWADRLLQGGSIRLSLDGKPLAWIKGSPALLDRAEFMLAGAQADGVNLLFQMNAVVSNYLNTRCSGGMTFKQLPPADVLAAKRLVPPRLEGVSYAKGNLVRSLPSDWYEFFKVIHQANLLVRKSIADALAEQRVVGWAIRKHGPVLLAPEQAIDMFCQGRQKIAYLPTTDIPDIWFRKNLALHQKQAVGRRYLTAVFQRVDSWGKRLSKLQAIKLLNTGFDLTNNAAGKVWKTVRADMNRKDSGAIKAHMQLSPSELKELESMGKDF